MTNELRNYENVNAIRLEWQAKTMAEIEAQLANSSGKFKLTWLELSALFSVALAKGKANKKNQKLTDFVACLSKKTGFSKSQIYSFAAVGDGISAMSVQDRQKALPNSLSEYVRVHKVKNQVAPRKTKEVERTKIGVLKLKGYEPLDVFKLKTGAVKAFTKDNTLIFTFKVESDKIKKEVKA